jgi:hypothetical protein
VRRTVIIASTLAAFAAACGGGSDPAAQATPSIPSFLWPAPSYGAVQSIFSSRCISCHGGAAPQAGMSLASPGSWDNLVGKPTTATTPAGTRVVPFDSAGSVVYQRITSADPLFWMPLSPNAPLAQAQIDAVRNWIETGGARQDVRFTMQEMTPHLGEKVLVRLQSDSGELRVRAILDPLTDVTSALLLPRAMPGGSHVIDFFADHDRNGAYSAPPADHAWRVGVPATGLVTFVHNTSFTDVGATATSEPGLPFTFSGTGFTPHLGQLFGLAVYHLSTVPPGVTDRRLVGLYRLAAVPAASFSITIPGIIQAGEDYSVDFFADLNGNEAYDLPPTDHAWRVDASSDAAGLAVSFAHAVTFTDIGRDP